MEKYFFKLINSSVYDKIVKERERDFLNLQIIVFMVKKQQKWCI